MSIPLKAYFLDYNYVFQDTVNLSSSSSDPEFPVSNIQNQIRSKVWRSSGNFVVAGTLTIDFQKVALGAELHAIVAAGTYTTATLAAAIKSALEAADGVNTYTVTYGGSTGLWTVATSGAFLSFLWNTGTHTATSFGPVIGFSTLSDSTGATSYTGSIIAIHTEEWVTVDTLTPQNIDSFVMIFDAMRGNQFSSTAVLTIMANATNVWSSPAVSQVLSINANYDIASQYFGSSQNYRYWRLKIVDPSNSNLYVEVSKLILALATQLSRVPANGFTLTLDDQSQISRNDYGHEYADNYPVKKVINISYTGLTASDIATLHSIYLKLGRITPLFFVIDPTSVLFNKDEYSIYGKFMSAVAPTTITRDIFSQTLDFQEVF